MRRHHLYGIFLAALFGAGVLTQTPTSQPALARHLTGDSKGPDPASGLVLMNARLKLTSFSQQQVDPPPPPAPPPPPPPAPPPPQPPARPAVKSTAAPTASASGSSAGVWAELRQCESGGDYATNTGNGYYGAYQFALSTWESLGYSGLPSSAPPAEQDQAAHQLQARNGWGQWPVCSRKLGLT